MGFKQILCLADSAGMTHEAMREAGRLAERHQATLTFLYVTGRHEPLNLLFPHRREWRTMQRPRWIGETGGLYDQVRAITGLPARRLSIVLETGNPDDAVIAAEREGQPDLVVIPGHISPVRILRAVSCAVMVVRKHNGHGVLAATDLSDPAHPALNAAREVAQFHGEHLSGMFGLHIPEIAALGVWGTHIWTASATQETADAVRKELREAMESIRASGSVIVEHGFPAEAILRTASRMGIGLIVVHSRGKGLFARLLFGSVSEIVAASASCSVLVTKSVPVQKREAA